MPLVIRFALPAAPGGGNVVDRDSARPRKYEETFRASRAQVVPPGGRIYLH